MGKKQVRQISYEEMKEYGELFKSLRLSIGYSQDRLSKKIGVFRTTLHRWEKGQLIPQQDIYEIEQMIRSVVDSVKLKNFRFGDIIENGYASNDNPTRIGIFIKLGSKGYECTNGKGRFWTIPTDNDKLKHLGNTLR
jgi:DNA-binding XRE family transcriptional regulator